MTVWPEGIGAAACYILDEKGEFVENDVLAGEAVLLDLGVYTLDALKLVDGSFNPEALEHATWEDAGLMFTFDSRSCGRSRPSQMNSPV